MVLKTGRALRGWRTWVALVVFALASGVEADQAAAQGWPRLQTDAAGARVLAAFERGPYGKMARGRVVRETPVAGVYALVDPTGKYSPIFTDAKITRIKNGGDAWIDVASGRPLPAAQARALRSDMAKRIAVDRGIAFQYGSGKEHAVLVSAYDCPYCRQLEQKLDKGSFNGVLYLFPMALQHNRPAAMALARDVWCSPDPGPAWKAAILDRKQPARAPASCTKDARDTTMLMALFDIKGVPARINPDGRVSRM